MFEEVSPAYAGPGLVAAAPWREVTDHGTGYLSVYFSEPLARWPVREITRRGDNKSDPNIETMTYGLFSTCEPDMRNRIVSDGRATVFFLTTRYLQPKPRCRVLTGYYQIGWYTEGSQGSANRDFALAASTMRFIDPIAVDDLPGPLDQLCGTQFRNMRPIDAISTSSLRAICDEQPDRTAFYMAEVERVERFARSQTGLAYPSWGRTLGFNKGDAAGFYFTGVATAKVPNSSKSGHWRCTECDYIIKNEALLKRCPVCKAQAALVPSEVDG